MIEGLLDGLAGLDAHWFLLLAFFLPFGETVALLDAIVPGEVGMVLLGAAASDAGVPIPLVIAIGALGAFAGDSTSWFIGHRWGYRLITRWEPIHRRMAKPLEVAERHFEAKGGRTVFAGRFVGALRALVPMVAGTSGMSYRKFLPWNVAASILWVSAVVILGAVFGNAVASTVDRFGVALTSLVVALAVGLFLRHKLRQRRASADQTANAPPAQAEREG